ncbi:M28 family peptidase [Ammoniphilus sp. CFH 90114]|uniref:M28 family peptidase n=1 Tax=Ammoniphilus sp. CFH 90114 TaxID=2493665 RepID=UPI00100F2410|nr:M28 family peptidase [Ammoniphilus sp. CFH 90114]RXT03877.1 DUF4910 domain-containing protein [Ammoniphilus sp. CFH 90114]
MIKKKAVILTLTGVMTLTGLFSTVPVLSSSHLVFASPNENAAVAFDKKVLSRIQSEKSMEHIRQLSVEIGERVAGMQGEKTAAEYIKKQLEEYGYDVTVQEFNIADRKLGHLLIPSLSDKFIPVSTPAQSASTIESGLKGTFMAAGFGAIDQIPEEVAGNIAVIERGGGLTFVQKVQNAVAAGATGVVIYDNVESLSPINPSLTGYTSPIPVVGIMKKDGEKLVSQLANQQVEGTVTVNQYSNLKSQNLIVSRKPNNKNKDSQQIVHVTAHYDSVPNSPGANDNASGTSVLLEFARILKAYPIDKEVRFVFFGAEEIGLVGSRYYVNQLSQDEIDRSIANFNMDMVGTAWPNATMLYVNTVDGNSNIVFESAQAAGARLDNHTTFLYKRGASDHVPFYEAGIPSANFIRREAVTASLEPYYHTPSDTIENISQSRIQEAGEIIGSALYDVLRTKNPSLTQSKVRRTEAEMAPFYDPENFNHDHDGVKE